MSNQTAGLIVVVGVVAYLAWLQRGKSRSLSQISMKDWVLYVGAAALLVCAIIVLAIRD